MLHRDAVFQSPPVDPTQVTVGGGAAATKLLKCGSAAVIVCPATSTVEGMGVAVPDGSR